MEIQGQKSEIKCSDSVEKWELVHIVDVITERYGHCRERMQAS